MGDVTDMERYRPFDPQPGEALTWSDLNGRHGQLFSTCDEDGADVLLFRPDGGDTLYVIAVATE